MELGQYQLQIFTSLVVILGAAFVALVCDYLKGNNEQLRELATELKTRNEEEQKRSTVLAARATKAEPAATAAPVMSGQSAAPVVAAAPRERSAASKDRKRVMHADAIAAMERGAALAGAGARPRAVQAAAVARPVEQSVTPVTKQVIVQATVPAVVQPVKQDRPEIMPEVIPAIHEQAAALKPTISAAKKDWGSLLSRNASGLKAVPKPVAPAIVNSGAIVNEDLLAVVVGAPAAGSSLPAGFHEGYVLNQLVQSHQPVSGLVVSIGVNSSQKSGGALPESIHKLVQSLIGPNDFAAQSNDEEFLLIFPDERGASAQRRLSEIAQQLWDFQLRSLGSYQILFSWGGVEVRSESIDEAIASASERMQETKRGRKLLTMMAPAPAATETKLRKAV